MILKVSFILLYTISGGIGTKGILVTSGGQLKVKHVIHLNVEELEANNTWLEGIQRCLQVADDKQLQTISFPALGTGISDQSVTSLLYCLHVFHSTICG